jgi:hypothetical protein
MKKVSKFLSFLLAIFPPCFRLLSLPANKARQTMKQTTTMRPEPELVEAYLLGRIGTICPFTDGLLVDAWECGFIHAMNA